MNAIDRFRAWFGGREEKASATGELMMKQHRPVASWMRRTASVYAQEGYEQNVVAYRCVRLIASSAARVPWCLVDNETDEKIYDHPVLELLRNPNPRDRSTAQFFEAVFSHYLIAGETFIEGVGPLGGPPREIYTLEPYLMDVVAGDTLPSKFVFSTATGKVSWPVDQLTGQSEVLHTKAFNPRDRWRGLSPMGAAAFSIDQHNAAAEWNAALLQNGASPATALIYKGAGDNAVLSQDQRKTVREIVDKEWSGPKNAGAVHIVPAHFDLKTMSASNKDLDWSGGKQLAAKEVAMAFNVPEQLVGVEGSQKFDNYAQARLALWEDAIIPLLGTYAEEISHWLGEAFNLDGLTLAHDFDDVEALAPRRQQKWDRAKGSEGFTTINDRRAMVGLAPLGDPDDPENPYNKVLINAGQIPADIDSHLATDEPADEDAKAMSVVAFGGRG